MLLKQVFRDDGDWQPPPEDPNMDADADDDTDEDESIPGLNDVLEDVPDNLMELFTDMFLSAQSDPEVIIVLCKMFGLLA